MVSKKVDSMAEESMDTKKETNTDRLMIQADTISMGIGKNSKSSNISNNSLLAQIDSMVMPIIETTEVDIKAIIIIEMDLKDTGIKKDIEEDQVDTEDLIITTVERVDSLDRANTRKATKISKMNK